MSTRKSGSRKSKGGAGRASASPNLDALGARLDSQMGDRKVTAIQRRPTSKLQKVRSMATTIEDEMVELDLDDKEFQLPRPKENAKENQVLEEVRDLTRSIIRETDVPDNPDLLFAEETQASAIRVIRLGLDDVREQEIRHERLRLAAVEEDTQRQQQALEGFTRHELEVRSAILRERHRYELRSKVLEERVNNFRLVQLKGSQNAVRKFENKLVDRMKKKGGAVVIDYPKLDKRDFSSQLYSTVRARKFLVRSLTAPRILRIRVDWASAIKNKVPKGKYVVLASIWNRLGGYPMRYSKISSFDTGKDSRSRTHSWIYSGCTPYPQMHQGKFNSLHLSWSQAANRIFLLCPAAPVASPSLVLVLELMLVRGASSRRDRTVGWGAFPLQDAANKLVSGQFKVPLIRGEIDLRVKTWQQLADRHLLNLDSWLCNMYFDAKEWLTSIDGEPTYEVEMRYTGAEAEGQEEEEAGGGEEEKYPEGGEGGEEKEGSGGAEVALPHMEMEDSSVELTDDEAEVAAAAAAGEEKSESSKEPGSPGSPERARSKKRGLGFTKGSVIEDQRFKDASKGGKRFKVNIKKVETTGNFKSRVKDPTSLPLSSLPGNKQQAALNDYRQSVRRSFGTDPLGSFGWRRLHWIQKELTHDLQLSRSKRRWLFWETWLLLLLLAYATIYTHYLGELLYLRAYQVPAELHLWLYTAQIEYATEGAGAATQNQEVALTVVGPFTNWIIYLVACFSMVLFQLFASPPERLRRTMLCWGLVVVLDMWRTLLLDLATQNWQWGSAFRLYHLWKKMSPSSYGVFGIVYTVGLTFTAMCVSCATLYWYFYHVHDHGRMGDQHARLVKQEEELQQLPGDFEISVKTLRRILNEGKKWQSFNGEQKKVLVTQYVVEDHLVRRDRPPKKKQVGVEQTDEKRRLNSDREAVNYHIALYKEFLNGDRALHRHFLRRRDGALHELFDDVAGMGRGAPGSPRRSSAASNRMSHVRQSQMGPGPGQDAKRLHENLRSLKAENWEGLRKRAKAQEADQAAKDQEAASAALGLLSMPIKRPQQLPPGKGEGAAAGGPLRLPSMADFKMAGLVGVPLELDDSDEEKQAGQTGDSPMPTPGPAVKTVTMAPRASALWFDEESEDQELLAPSFSGSSDGEIEIDSDAESMEF